MVGSGTATEVERGDGSQVEVHLDRNLDVIGQEADDDGQGDQEGPDNGSSSSGP